jgi:hypothetical protein
MTTLRQIELRCPVCEQRFRSLAAVSTNAFGGKDTDFHEHAAGVQPLPSWDGVAREERAVLTYLVGELWRRVGDRRQARAWFDRVPNEIVDPSRQRWLIDAARQQRDCPRETFR